MPSALLVAHHEPLAKFDDKKPLRLRGVVTLVDWRNPHAHVFVNVKSGEQLNNWAVELESPKSSCLHRRMSRRRGVQLTANRQY